MLCEELAIQDPNLPSAIRVFLVMVEPLGVYTDLKASLNLKIDHPETNNPINVGYIHKNGTLWTKSLVGGVSTDIAMRYNQTLSNLIGGDMLGWGPWALSGVVILVLLIPTIIASRHLRLTWKVNVLANVVSAAVVMGIDMVHRGTI